MVERVFPRSKSQSRLALFVGAALAVAAAVCAQSAPQAAPAQPLAYEVVSIKPHQASADDGMWWRYTPDGFSTSGTPLKNLIMGAYELIMPDQLSGLPGWADSDPFDIQAKMDEDAAAAFQKLPLKEQRHRHDLMLQSMLADRFQLKVHHEVRELPVYDLVIAKDGLKMKQAVADPRSGWVMYDNRIFGKSVPIDSFSDNLSNVVGRIVIDKTGLKGNYAVALKWTPDGQQETADSGPGIFAALQEQLGLKLVPAKGPVDTIVVDRVEKPSPN